LATSICGHATSSPFGRSVTPRALKT
jgi:hypothetical protein